MTRIEKRLTDLKALQESGAFTRCPRCGLPTMKPKLYTNALSRIADIMVCDRCGMVEALEKAGLVEAVPLMKWCCIDVPQNGGGEWKR